MSFYYWISVINCWLNTQSNFISWHHSEQDQGSSESLEIQVFFGYLSILGGLLAVKNQGGVSVSLFEEHKKIIYVFVIVISIYVATIIVGKKLGTKAIEPIRLLAATIAPILLFLIVVPELGWPALGLWVIKTLQVILINSLVEIFLKTLQVILINSLVEILCNTHFNFYCSDGWITTLSQLSFLYFYHNMYNFFEWFTQLTLFIFFNMWN